MEKQKFIDGGKIINTHGVAGEVKLEVWLDSPQFLKRFKRIFIDGKPVNILSSRVQKDFLLAKLEGVDDVNAAMALKGKEFTVFRDDITLPKGSYFLQDIIGAKIVDEGGNLFGILKEIIETPASKIYVVSGSDGAEHLIPAVDEFILSTDVKGGIITAHIIEGM